MPEEGGDVSKEIFEPTRVEAVVEGYALTIESGYDRVRVNHTEREENTFSVKREYLPKLIKALETAQKYFEDRPGA
jgi:hypothetical protein